MHAKLSSGLPYLILPHLVTRSAEFSCILLNLAVRFSSLLFSVMREGKLGDVIRLDNNALPTSQIFRRNDDANEITAIIPNATLMTTASRLRHLLTGTDYLKTLGLLIDELYIPYSSTF